ncbi:MAG: hypothetical protein WBQ95_10670 [Terracidiphilus sp.]
MEEQIANATEEKPPRPGEVLMTEAERRIAADQRAASERRKQALNLQRENILSQRTSNPARRVALSAALSDIEAQINALE